MTSNSNRYGAEDRPVVFARKQSNEVLKAQIKEISIHGVIFLFWLISAHLLTRMFLYLGAGMWVLGAIAARMLPNERESIIRNTQRFVLSYSSLVIFKLFIFFVTEIPASEWGRALGMSVGDALSMTALNYLSMVFWITSFGVPLAFLTYIGSTFFTFRSDVDVKERTRQIIRTGEQRSHSDRDEARRRRLGRPVGDPDKGDD